MGPASTVGRLKAQRMVSALSFLQQYAVHGHDFLERIVTGDEMWVHYHSPETKRTSIAWKHPGSQRSKRFKRVRSAGKLAKWWPWCVGTARVYCWWIAWKRAQQSMQSHIVQPKNGNEQLLNDNALDCSQQVFCFCTIMLLQQNSCSASDGNLGTSAIQPRSGAKWFSPLSCS
jgi:hypothetical protein